MFKDLLIERMAGWCSLSSAQIDQLNAHFDLLQRWNQVLNLTAIRKEAEMVERHYCESLFLALHLPEGALSVADIGSGAGFPGVPVAIWRPDCQVTLIESHRRKAVFLKEATRGMANVRVLAERAEDVPEFFDWVICRAVKFGDIERTLVKLGRNAALLTGEAHSTDLGGFIWESSFQLPWGDRRLLWLGRNVSRET